MKVHPFMDYRCFLEAWCILHLMKGVIYFIPFKKVASRIGKIQAESDYLDVNSKQLDDVRISIGRAIRFTLFKSVCYDQALTAKLMLKRREFPSTLYLGLSKDEKNQMIAHAWVRCGNKIITGKAGMDQFTVVAFFS
jgi:hypothetical protein